MQAELDAFAAFYNEKHQGHKLEWNHALGTVTLWARFATGQKELSVSLYQAVVLLLFNEMTEIPFADVKLHTGIGESPCYLPASKQSEFSSFAQRTRSCGAYSRASRAGRKGFSRNGLPGKMCATTTYSCSTTRSRTLVPKYTSTLFKLRRLYVFFPLPLGATLLNGLLYFSRRNRNARKLPSRATGSITSMQRLCVS